MLLGAVADLHEIIERDYDADGDNSGIEDAVKLIGIAAAKNVTSKTWLYGVSQAVNAISDPERYAEGYARRFGASLVPFSSALRNSTGAADPFAREVFTLLDQLKANTPGMSDSLPHRRDYLGRPVEHGKPWLSPIAMSQASTDPLDLELARLAFEVNMPNRSIQGVPLNASQYSRLLELRGQHAFGGSTLKEVLRDYIETEAYRELPEDRDLSVMGTKGDAIRRIASRYQSAAKERLLEEDAELAAKVEAERDRRRRNLEQ